MRYSSQHLRSRYVVDKTVARPIVHDFVVEQAAAHRKAVSQLVLAASDDLVAKLDQADHRHGVTCFAQGERAFGIDFDRRHDPRFPAAEMDGHAIVIDPFDIQRLAAFVSGCPLHVDAEGAVPQLQLDRLAVGQLAADPFLFEEGARVVRRIRQAVGAPAAREPDS